MNFIELYHSYKDTVYNVALQYTQNVEDAEEITQDVFLKIHDNLDRFQNLSSWKTWIYRIAINQAIDFLKAKKSQKRMSFFSALSLSDEEYPVDISVLNHPGIIVEQKEDLEVLFRSINQLSDQQKTVLILLRIEQKTIDETAEIMNLSYKAVESLYQRAKKNLAEIIEKSKKNS